MPQPTDHSLQAEIAARYEQSRLTGTVAQLAEDLGLTKQELYNAAARLPTQALYPNQGTATGR